METTFSQVQREMVLSSMSSCKASIQLVTAPGLFNVISSVEPVTRNTCHVLLTSSRSLAELTINVPNRDEYTCSAITWETRKDLLESITFLLHWYEYKQRLKRKICREKTVKVLTGVKEYFMKF